MTDTEVYAAIGDEGFHKLVRAFYAQVPGDDILGPMYPANEMQEAEERLRDFLIYRFGGPPKYILERGHPRLRMRHMPFAIDQAARDRWMQLMVRAMQESQIPPEAAEVLGLFFREMATFMINRP